MQLPRCSCRAGLEVVQAFEGPVHEIRDLRSEDEPQSDGDGDHDGDLNQLHAGALPE